MIYSAGRLLPDCGCVDAHAHCWQERRLQVRSAVVVTLCYCVCVRVNICLSFCLLTAHVCVCVQGANAAAGRVAAR